MRPIHVNRIMNLGSLCGQYQKIDTSKEQFSELPHISQ